MRMWTKKERKKEKDRRAKRVAQKTSKGEHKNKAMCKKFKPRLGGVRDR